MESLQDIAACTATNERMYTDHGDVDDELWGLDDDPMEDIGGYKPADFVRFDDKRILKAIPYGVVSPVMLGRYMLFADIILD